nr:MAG TPA: hypothetical protein [Caudoviricetes sp.]
MRIAKIDKNRKNQNFKKNLVKFSIFENDHFSIIFGTFLLNFLSFFKNE